MLCQHIYVNKTYILNAYKSQTKQNSDLRSVVSQLKPPTNIFLQQSTYHITHADRTV